MSASPSRRRCLIVVPDLGRGGAERQAVLVGLALQEQGLEVRLFVQSEPHALMHDGLTGQLEVDTVESAGSLLRQLLRLRRTVETFAPHVVITFLRGAEARFALTRAASAVARRAAWIATARGNVRLLHLALAPATFGAQLVWQRLADRLCPNSASLAGNLITMDDTLSNKVVVVPNIVQRFLSDPETARARVDALIGGDAHRPVIGCVGSFQDERNYALLADALPLVLSAHSKAHVLVIGRSTGPWVSAVAAAFQARIDALGLRQHVTVAGEIPDARQLLAGLDVFALPSKLEGSSNALSEAMVAGVATAAAPVADSQDLLGGAGVVSRGWTPVAFAEAIVTAIDSGAELRGRARARGEALAVERSPERVGAQWAALVDEAVAAANARAS